MMPLKLTTMRWGGPRGGRRGLVGIKRVAVPNPLENYILLAPGESITKTFKTVTENVLLTHLTITCTYKSNKSIAYSMKPNDEPKNKEYLAVYNLLTPYYGKIFAKTDFLVVPEEIAKDKIQPLNGLQVSLETTKETFSKPEEIRFNLSFQNKKNENIGLAKHKDWGYPLWAIIKNSKGEVIQMGAIKEAVITDETEMKEDDLALIELLPGKDLVIPIAFRNTLPDGEYTLTIGYRVDVDDEFEREDIARIERRFWSGEVISNTIPFNLSPVRKPDK